MKYLIYCRKSSRAEDRQVMSIASQQSELRRVFGDRGDIEVVDVFEEAMSAQSPGRPKFAEMLDAIEAGAADGIMAWAPDRLARNSIDGGRIIYMLDRGVIKDLKFATYTFENNSQGKFMLQIMFGQSKYYSDALSENVRRGLRTRLANGWHPNLATFGYMNDRTARAVVPDRERLALVRKMFELALTGNYSGRRIARIARDEWGLRTPKRKRIGGVPIGAAAVHRILTNPFYAGIIISRGQRYPGKHEAIISIQEFEAVQRLLRRPTRERAQKHQFAYTGLIRCGACGLAVTAEHKVNRHGSHYLYYHCSRRAIGARCREPAIRTAVLEQQLVDFFKTLYIKPQIETWLFMQLDRVRQSFDDEASVQRQSLALALASTQRELRELTGLRLRQLIDDEEFMSERKRLQMEEIKAQAKLNEASSADRFAPIGELISFSILAAVWFWRAKNDDRRLILQTVGSNPTLADKKVSVQAAKPFVALSKTVSCLILRGRWDDVRTPGAGVCPMTDGEFRQQCNSIIAALEDPACAHILPNIRALRERLGQDGREAASGGAVAAK